MLCREVVSAESRRINGDRVADGEKYIACKLVFMAPEIGTRSLQSHIRGLRGDAFANPLLPELRRVVNLGSADDGSNGVQLQTYNAFTSSSQATKVSVLERAESLVKPEDILNLQFTSGKLSFRSRSSLMSVLITS